jgi:membrane protein implicated in regulation of membrane protease activity
MTWADFYLVCFAIGFTFSLFSFLLGGLHWHLPHGLGHGGHAGPVSPPAAIKAAAARGGHVCFLSPATLAAFLAWFGGTGYLLTRFSALWFLIALLLATLAGLVGACIVFVFLSKVLTSADENLDATDFEMTGVWGKICSSIREGGTGELIYSQAGTRRTCGARSETGAVIPKGSEVVVTRYEKGIAYVRLWNELAGEETPTTEREKSSS